MFIKIITLHFCRKKFYLFELLMTFGLIALFYFNITLLHFCMVLKTYLHNCRKEKDAVCEI